MSWSTRVPTVHPSARTTAQRPRTVCSKGARTITIRSRQVWSPGYASAYVVQCTVVISRGAQLALAPGTVVELGGGSIYIAPRGSLVAGGSAFRPVFFTSLPGEGYSQVITMDGQASVRISHAIFQLGSSGTGASAIVGADPMVISGCAAHGGDTLVVKASVLGAPINLGQCESATAGSHFWLSSNRFEDDAGFSLSGSALDTVHLGANSFHFDAHARSYTPLILNRVPVQGVVLSGPGTNTFSSPVGPLATSLQNATVPSGTSWAFSSPDRSRLAGQVTVDGTAVITPGAILSGAALTVGAGGSLRAAGTARRPVRFAGGSAVEVTGAGSLLVDHAIFSGTNAEDIYEGACTGDGRQSVTVEDSIFQGTVGSGDFALGNCDTKGSESLLITGNLFRTLAGVTALGLSVPGAGGPENPSPGSLTIANNVFQPRPGPRPATPLPELSVYGWPIQGVALSGPGANRFLGQMEGRVVDLSDCQVPPGTSWTVAPGNGPVLEAQADYFGNPGITVDGRLVLDAGSIVKVGITRILRGGVGVGFGVALGNHGTLDALGTATRPVTFTSMADDSVGGESYGVKTTTSQHDYENAVSAEEGSHVNVTHAVFRHGWYAFQAGCGPKPRNGGSFVLTQSLIDDEVDLGDCDGSQHGYAPRLRGNIFAFNGAASANFAAGGGYDPAALQPAVLLFNIDPSGLSLSARAATCSEARGRAGWWRWPARRCPKAQRGRCRRRVGRCSPPGLTPTT